MNLKPLVDSLTLERDIKHLPFKQLPGGGAGAPGGDEEGEGGRAQQLSRHDDGHCYHCPRLHNLAINFLKT